VSDDLDLLYAWRAGDRAAGDRLMRTYYPQVLGFFRLRVAEAADDLTQRTFLACTEALDRVSSSSFRAYVFGIARHMLIKHVETADRRRDALTRFDAPQPQSVLTPSGVVSLRQEHWLLLRALERLPLDRQIPLALHYVQGLRSREIAEVLEIPTSTVTTRLQRAREALREQVQALRAPAAVRDSLLADLDTWTRSLAPG
jgi:RNA polymerase sigma factor (sigma-70 family)